MFQTDILIDTAVLPSNIMSLRDDNFIDFVKGEAGHAAAALLELQGITQESKRRVKRLVSYLVLTARPV